MYLFTVYAQGVNIFMENLWKIEKRKKYLLIYKFNL